MNRSIKSLQFLRVIAAWMVVFRHFVQIFQEDKVSNLFDFFFQKYGSIGVDIFFIISGFIIYTSTIYNQKSPREFLINRIARIVPAYWFFTAVTALLIFFFKNLIPLTEFDPLFLLKSFLFIPAQNPSGIGFFPIMTVGWTLNYEAIFYLLFGASLFFRLSYRVSIIGLMLCLLKNISHGVDGDLVFYDNNIIFEFLIGIIIAIIYSKTKLRISSYLSTIIILSSIYIIPYSMNYTNYRYLNIGIPIGVIITMFLSQERYFNLPSLLKWLSDWSYSTYLIHCIILGIGYKISQIYNINSYLILLSCCSIIILFSGLSYNLLEKPALIFINKWKNNSRYKLEHTPYPKISKIRHTYQK